MRALQALALAAALTLPVAPLMVATTAHAGDIPLSQDGLLAAIKSDKVWCSRWQDKDQSCEEVTFLEAKKDIISQTRRYRMSESADIEMVISEKLKLEGGALCSTFKFEALDIVVLAGGEPAPDEQALTTRAVIAAIMADLEGKKTCAAFTQDDKTGLVKSTITLDGQAAPEFDTDYRLLSPDTRIQLRPVFEDTEASSIT